MKVIQGSFPDQKAELFKSGDKLALYFGTKNPYIAKSVCVESGTAEKEYPFSIFTLDFAVDDVKTVKKFPVSDLPCYPRIKDLGKIC